MSTGRGKREQSHGGENAQVYLKQEGAHLFEQRNDTDTVRKGLVVESDSCWAEGP